MDVSTLIGFVALFAVVTLVLTAALSDLRSMRISNTIPCALLLSYVILAPLTGATAAEMGLSLLAAALVFSVGFGLFCQGWIGGGDVKLAGAVVLWLGASQVWGFLAYTTLLGAVFGLLLMGFRHKPLAARLQTIPWVSDLHAHAGMPYGVPMAGAALLILPQTRLILPLIAG